MSAPWITFLVTVLASVWATGFLIYLAILVEDYAGWRRGMAAALWPYIFARGLLLSMLDEA